LGASATGAPRQGVMGAGMLVDGGRFD